MREVLTDSVFKDGPVSEIFVDSGWICLRSLTRADVGLGGDAVLVTVATQQWAV
jgi:hypothetical protein